MAAHSEDPEQIRLIRAHLEEEAEKSAGGGLHVPTMIHRGDMAGLDVLVMGPDRLAVTYREADRGAEICFGSDDPALVEAIHPWFDAQLMDHGEHAQAHR